MPTTPAVEPWKSAGPVLAHLRQQHRLDQPDLARLAGVTPKVVSDLEGGMRPASYRMLPNLLQGMSASAEDFMAAYAAALARGQIPRREGQAALEIMRRAHSYHQQHRNFIASFGLPDRELFDFFLLVDLRLRSDRQ